MIQALKEFGGRGTVSTLSMKPKILTLGGDDSLSLPALRALKETYGRLVRVLRFDGECFKDCFFMFMLRMGTARLDIWTMKTTMHGTGFVSRGMMSTTLARRAPLRAS